MFLWITPFIVLSLLVSMTMKPPVIPGTLRPASLLPLNSSSQVLHSLCVNTLTAVSYASRISLTHILPFSCSPLYIKSHASHPFQQVFYDFISNLPVSSSFNSLLVMVDHGLTKGVILCSTKKTTTTERVAVLFFHKVYLCFRLYDKIISDQGLQFASTFAKELGKLLHYDLSLSTAYHPQSDGGTECVNQEVKTYLQIFCRSNPGSRADKISHAEFTHNHHPHSITNQSLFYLMMGYEPHTLPSLISNSSIPTVETHLKSLVAARDETLTAHELSHQVMSLHNNQRFTSFSKGNKIWLEARNLKCLITNSKFTLK